MNIDLLINNIDHACPLNNTIHRIFEVQVEKTPDNIAVVYENQRLTYRELNEQSNQLAHFIRQYYKDQKCEFKPGTFVTLCLDKSLEMVIAIFAVLKAGGAYVPVDPDAPEYRIKYILDDTNSQLLLSQTHMISRLHILKNSKVALIGLDKLSYQHKNKINLLLPSQSTDLAYVIYTSGTTGLPKGVMVEHKGIVNYVSSAIRQLGLVQFDRHLLLHDYAFDLILTSLYGCLLSGASLHIINKTQQEDVGFVVEYLLQHNITFIKTTPLYMEAVFVNDPCFKDYCTHQKIKVVLGGEKLDYPLVCKLQESFSEGCLNLIYHYGPTEAVVGSHFLALNTTNRCQWFSINPVIGRGFDNVKSYILDQNQNPVPPGVMGELYIGGAGLARGYLNQPELTHERFVPNPFATEKDKAQGYTRLYKTGDLVRYLADGNIEYIGRNDFQVKIRGFRIELGEIEAILGQYPGIKQCVVLSYQEPHPYLAAFYVSATPLDGHLIRTHLSSCLPDYMVPSAIVPIDRIPLTLNGKLDRKALPAPEFKGQEYIAPRDETEALLCQIWQEVLGVEQVGITDDFFQLGGHSILAIQLSHRMSQALNRVVSVKDIRPLNIELLLSFIQCFVRVRFCR